MEIIFKDNKIYSLIKVQDLPLKFVNIFIYKEN